MKFINVTDEQYEIIKRISTESGCTVPEVIEDLIGGFKHFAILAFKQDLALRMAKELLCDEGDSDGEKEFEGNI